MSDASPSKAISGSYDRQRVSLRAASAASEGCSRGRLKESLGRGAPADLAEEEALRHLTLDIERDRRLRFP